MIKWAFSLMVKQRTHNPSDVGSIPTGPTTVHQTI